MLQKGSKLTFNEHFACRTWCTHLQPYAMLHQKREGKKKKPKQIGKGKVKFH
jgi:hypothetical protein